ncbi:Fe3+ hydroxamate ABC transporter substrate-binding protein [Bacillus sp. FSL K6-3431]|uniref:Fe3+ hydroxamate ABC transporter substrate-binding protein n=1 Tax=Bacillus sp. FSL K6-3431 TaxID=2921500 RepID=UPI0030F90A87
MFKKAICSRCEREIQESEEVYAKLNYPKHKVMVEIKAFLQKKSEIICKDCFKETKN